MRRVRRNVVGRRLSFDVSDPLSYIHAANAINKSLASSSVENDATTNNETNVNNNSHSNSLLRSSLSSVPEDRPHAMSPPLASPSHHVNSHPANLPSALSASSFLVQLHNTSRDDRSRDTYDERIRQLVSQSWRGLAQGLTPRLSETGVGGTYFLYDPENHRPIGVFKPHDEEMGGTLNPKGFTPGGGSYQPADTLRRGVPVGEAAFRECAAYLLDHQHFSGVPATDLVALHHPAFAEGQAEGEDAMKVGSFQEFRDHDFDAEDISPAKARRFPVEEVHKIAILDLRLFNTDRHGGNILVKEVNLRVRSHRSRSLPATMSPTRPPFVLPSRRTRSRKGTRFGTPSLDYSDSSNENSPHLSPSHDDMQFNMELHDLHIDDTDDEIIDESDGEEQSFTEESNDAGDEDDDEEDDDDEDQPSRGVTYELIPIDHGYTLPGSLSGLCDAWPEWMFWPQAKVPFGPAAVAYIARLNPERDCDLLRQRLGGWISSSSLFVLRVSTMWLQIGAKVGLTPYELGEAICRKIPEQPSRLEEMVSSARGSAIPPRSNDGENRYPYAYDGSDDAFFSKLSEAMEGYARQIRGGVSSRTRLSSPSSLDVVKYTAPPSPVCPPVDFGASAPWKSPAHPDLVNIPGPAPGKYRPPFARGRNPMPDPPSQPKDMRYSVSGAQSITV
eukprot:TRINITY_DN1683_c0_g1_i1.p1 TRINITY_DN1683_c0_g1~~TRINITY_DN1683_c0_g1_i1.p1  ORF type:complete len:671 (+),score=151.23 TRINITY_DN1683_c0_g1_i1:251-2263(+)